MNGIEDLIARVKAATGPDREIDAWIGYHTNLVYEDIKWRGKVDRMGIDHAVKSALSYNNIWSTALPAYTSSIDAIVALIEEKLPAAKCGIDPIFFEEDRSVQWAAIICIPNWERWSPVNSDWIQRKEARHENQVLAANLAFLTALASGDPS